MNNVDDIRLLTLGVLKIISNVNIIDILYIRKPDKYGHYTIIDLKRKIMYKC